MEQNFHQGDIAHYKVIKKIGSGGMGDVYLAEDTRLNRKVALKILPQEFTKDKVRVRRFEREAKTVTALNHPYILTIYDIGQFNSSTYIASEYIDGETLRQRMRTSKLVPLKEILTIVTQVAEALTAAHQAGIIHRDIKPENIMLRRDGYVKVLDFGLSKPMENSSNASALDTLSSPDTQTGVVVGTIRYMSPEQARGLKLDPRSDLFSLGIVFYEMLTGRVPFEGATAADMLAAILEKHPVALQNSGEYPEGLQWIVSKTLAKEPDERYQTTKEFVADLKRIHKQLEIDAEIKRSQSTTIKEPPTPKTKSTIAILSLITIVLVAIAFLLTLQKDQKIPAPKIPFSKIKLTRLTSSGSAWGGIISPDGKYFCYVQKSPQDQLSLYLRQLATDTEIVLLTLPQKTYFIGGRRFSHDGEYIYYLTSSSNTSSLYRMPVLGGVSQKLVDDIEYIPAISPDGKKIAFIREVQDRCVLMIANADGSNQKKLKTSIAIEYYSDLEWSPDGKMLVAVLLTKSGENKRILSIDLKDGSDRTLFDLDTSEYSNDVTWLSDQSGMILNKETEYRGQIYYVSHPDYKVTRITNDFNDYDGMLSVSQDSKSIVTTQLSYNTSLWGAPYAKPTLVTQLTSGSFIVDGQIGISWSKGRIFYCGLDSSGVNQILTIDADGTNKKQLTAGKPDKFWPAISANGKSIVYSAGEGGQIWIMGSNGENQKRLPTSKFVRFPRISPDAKWITYSSYDGEKHTLFKFDIESSKELNLAVHSGINSSAISPDGRFIAYAHDDGSENRLKIIPSDGGKPIKEFPLKEDVFVWGRIHWTPDGRGIGYILVEENGRNIYVQPVDGSPAYRLTNFNDDDKLYLSNFSWSPDGKHIAYGRGKSNSDIVMIQSLP